MKLVTEKPPFNLGKCKFLVHNEKFVAGNFSFDMSYTAWAPVIQNVKPGRRLYRIVISYYAQLLEIIHINPERNFVRLRPGFVYTRINAITGFQSLSSSDRTWQLIVNLLV